MERLVGRPYADLVRANRGEMISDSDTADHHRLCFCTPVSYVSGERHCPDFRHRHHVCRAMASDAGAPRSHRCRLVHGRPTLLRLGSEARPQGDSYNQMLASEMTETLSGIKEVKITIERALQGRKHPSHRPLSLVNRLWTRLAEAAPVNGAELVFGLGVITTFLLIGPDRDQLTRVLAADRLLFSGPVARAHASRQRRKSSLRGREPVSGLHSYFKASLDSSRLSREPPSGGLVLRSIDTPVRFEKVNFAMNRYRATRRGPSCVTRVSSRVQGRSFVSSGLQARERRRSSTS